MFRRCTDAPKLQLVPTKSFGRRPQTGPLAGCVEPSPAAATVLGANAGLDLKKECCRKALHIGSWLMSVEPIQLRDKVLRNISAQEAGGAAQLVGPTRDRMEYPSRPSLPERNGSVRIGSDEQPMVNQSPSKSR